VQRDPASFRDPSGHVYHDGARVLRTVGDRAVPGYEHARDSGALQAWIERGWVVGTRECNPDGLGSQEPNARYVLEHDRVEFISYPYEWAFAGLKAAALLHLDLQLDALERGIKLSDASAYNVQFDGARPVFIDVLSFRPYQDGEYWKGQRQFCEQFLNPLLLRAVLGVPHNAWYRGSVEGIAAHELNALLPASRKLSWKIFAYVTLPARMAARVATSKRPPAPPRRPLPRAAYKGLLTQLRDWIAGLSPRGEAKTTWSDYDTTQTYTDEERARKRAVVGAFVERIRPRMLWDFGCNTGDYAQLALQSGAGRVIGFDADHGALDRAFDRAVTHGLKFLPLYLDAANPTPAQGWNERGRRSLSGRGPADAVIALAFVHHLAIARNVPLDEVLGWLTSLAPSGVVEFVSKSDPTIQRMLAAREDVFSDYNEQVFTTILSRLARIVRTETISGTGRRLFIYER
jgi:ribosomal protein L11 methylase PrmA